MLLLLVIIIAATAANGKDDSDQQRHAYIRTTAKGDDGKQSEVKTDLGPIDDDSGHILRCDHHRYTTLQHVLDALDSDGDRCLSTAEMQVAFDQCLSTLERIVMRIGRFFGSVETPQAIIAKCDSDGDGRMCVDDALVTQRACTAYARAFEENGRGDSAPTHCLCSCKAIGGVHEYILDRWPCKK